MTTQQTNDEIGQFFDHFRRMSAYFQKQLTPDFHSPANHELLAGKMACCALLDALSMARFPDEQGHKKRFCDFVGQFSSCDCWGRISIPQLLYGLQRSSDIGHDRLKKHAESLLARQAGYAITQDPLCSELITRFPESETKVNKYCHLHLFYRYRCNLVHEMRIPGEGYEFESTLKPCYQGETEIPTGRLIFRLTYPLKFFFSLCDECTANLEKYFLTGNKSPYEVYRSRFGDDW